MSIHDYTFVDYAVAAKICLQIVDHWCELSIGSLLLPVEVVHLFWHPASTNLDLPPADDFHYSNEGLPFRGMRFLEDIRTSCVVSWLES